MLAVCLCWASAQPMTKATNRCCVALFWNIGEDPLLAFFWYILTSYYTNHNLATYDFRKPLPSKSDTVQRLVG